MNKYLAEFIGTFWLVFGGCGSAIFAATFPELRIGFLGVALAFFRLNGMTLERWIVARVRFLFRPQRRVWTRGGGRRIDANAELRYDEATPSTPAPQPAASAPRVSIPVAAPLVASISNQAVIIFADLAMILALFALTFYLRDGGWAELQSWYMNLSR